MKKRNKLIMAVLAVVLISIMGMGTVKATTVNEQTETAVQNYVLNGDFKLGTMGWSSYMHNKCATFESKGNGFAKVAINWLEGNDWHVMLIQKNLPMSAGDEYTLSFDAYASKARSIKAGFKNGSMETFELTKKKQHFEYHFKFNISGDNEFQFIMGTVGGNTPSGAHDVYVGNVSIVKKGENPQGSSTKVIDHSKEKPSVKKNGTYYILKNRASSYVMDVVDTEAQGYLVQSPYTEATSQIFTLVKSNGNYVLKNLATGKVIQQITPEDERESELVLRKADGSTSQEWIKETVAQGYLKFYNAESNRVCSIVGGYASKGQPVALVDETENSEQEWDLIPVDAYTIVNGKQKVVIKTNKDWKKKAIKYPGKTHMLVAAGPIYFQWYAAPNEKKVKEYRVYADGKRITTKKPAGKKSYETKWYNTSVKAHTMKVVTVMKSGSSVSTADRKFWISKKGLGWGTLFRTQDMGLSWYYHWSTEPALGADEDLQFVPMIWGNWGDKWLADKSNKKYKQVLAFNEPDFNEQSNVSVSDALVAMKAYKKSGLRVGSPCTAVPAYWSQDWFWKFMDGVKKKNLKVDFIAVHCYLESGDPKPFLDMIDATWKKWHKPIWITEFGVAEWNKGKWNNWTEGANNKVYKFMKTVIPELDKRSYVERYAWFPFDPDDEWGGASGIFDYETGKLNKLGKLYKKLGMPKGY